MSCENMMIRNRTLRTLPGKLLLGSVGARLGVDYLDPVPGFAGRIDFIHKMNIPLLFSVQVEGDSHLLPPPESIWYPDRLDVRWQNSRYTLLEQKWITWEDQALCRQIWHNRSSAPLVLRLLLPEGATGKDRSWLWQCPATIHGLCPIFRVSSSVSWQDGYLILAPGEKLSIMLCAAAALPEEKNLLCLRAEQLLTLSPDALLADQRAAYEAWFDAAPQFCCDQPYLEACWRYRWYILRTCLCRPDTGLYHHITMYEGRSHKVAKDAYAPSGWEFTKLVPLSTPLHVMDLRWHRTDIAKEILRSLVDSADEKGVWRCLYTDERLADYANCSAYSLYQLYLVDEDKNFLREVLPAFKRNCMAVYEAYKGQNDHLQVEYIHQHTGKEYQPSYWYFSDGYPDHVNRNREGYTPLKRVDRSIYCYLDFLGLSHLCTALDDPEAEVFLNLAQTIGREVLEKMWDEDTCFFYDLHYLDDRKALVKNIVGMYPFWAGITDEQHEGALRYLSDNTAFATGSGFASVAADCPVFSACGGWKGDFFKGRNGCMWNGPSWPYTTGIVLTALAESSRRLGHRYDDMFSRFLGEYTLQHFTGHDIGYPYLVEHYNSITGEPLSDEPDYNHSCYIDLIVRCVAGILPEEKGLIFDPIDCGINSFILSGVSIRGRMAEVTKGGDVYTVKLDGQMRYRGSGGKAVFIPYEVRKERESS